MKITSECGQGVWLSRELLMEAQERLGVDDIYMHLKVKLSESDMYYDCRFTHEVTIERIVDNVPILEKTCAILTYVNGAHDEWIDDPQFEVDLCEWVSKQLGVNFQRELGFVSVVVVTL